MVKSEGKHILVSSLLPRPRFLCLHTFRCHPACPHLKLHCSALGMLVQYCVGSRSSQDPLPFEYLTCLLPIPTLQPLTGWCRVCVQECGLEQQGGHIGLVGPPRAGAPRACMAHPTRGSHVWLCPARRAVPLWSLAPARTTSMTHSWSAPEPLEQVSQTAPTGEYLTTGSFMIRGRKNYLPPQVQHAGHWWKVDMTSLCVRVGTGCDRGVVMFVDFAAMFECCTGMRMDLLMQFPILYAVRTAPCLCL